MKGMYLRPKLEVFKKKIIKGRLETVRVIVPAQYVPLDLRKIPNKEVR